MGVCSIECFCSGWVAVICLVVVGNLVGCWRGRERGVCIILVCVGVVCCSSGDVGWCCGVISVCVWSWSGWGIWGGSCG